MKAEEEICCFLKQITTLLEFCFREKRRKKWMMQKSNLRLVCILNGALTLVETRNRRGGEVHSKKTGNTDKDGGGASRSLRPALLSTL